MIVGVVVEAVAEMMAEARVEEAVEVMAVGSLGFVLTFAQSAEGGGNAEAWNKELVACRASPLPLPSPCVSESEGEKEEVSGMMEVETWPLSSPCDWGASSVEALDSG